ncbi:pyridoxine biosynthesis glutamine amidotransferase [Gracilibacillus boraciitolerans JCM 21714]|uniref:glutaminase n=1 Tax=Gracilibacillus boraciitolerans JCM 21714 TaxID=1298598 RepID=W4VM17_9BACI|nr:pyridoxine biosynthesis glutamine amidotransferase [Gracilibacillus boraciitolerans JCM 21714]
MVKIGVLGLQGAIPEHIRSVQTTGVEGIIIKRKEQLDEIDGLILPGGESTTMRRLIDKYDFFDALVTFGNRGETYLWHLCRINIACQSNYWTRSCSFIFNGYEG